MGLVLPGKLHRAEVGTWLHGMVVWRWGGGGIALLAKFKLWTLSNKFRLGYKSFLKSRPLCQSSKSFKML